jgi:hypothetical protein
VLELLIGDRSCERNRHQVDDEQWIERDEFFS